MIRVFAGMRRYSRVQSKPTLTTSQVAAMLGVHPDTVLRLVREGALPAWQLSPRSVRRYRRSDVEALLADAEARMQGAAA